MNIHVRENINICVVGVNKYAYKYRTAKINHIMHFWVNFKFLVNSTSFFLSLVHSQSLIQDSTNRSEKTNVALFMHFFSNTCTLRILQASCTSPLHPSFPLGYSQRKFLGIINNACSHGLLFTLTLPRMCTIIKINSPNKCIVSSKKNYLNDFKAIFRHYNRTGADEDNLVIVCDQCMLSLLVGPRLHHTWTYFDLWTLWRCRTCPSPLC